MFQAAGARWKGALHEIIFESRTPKGRAFDIALILVIAASVVVVVLESVAAVRATHGLLLRRIEWAFTLLFTAEYLLRLVVVARPRKYALSFFGIVDLLAIVPTYLSLLLPGAQALLVIRVVRILRIFHVFELSRHEGAARMLLQALRTARYPITVFLVGLSVLVIFLGALIFLVEGAEAGITSIPMGIYWAVVTVTTLGYGDVVPISPAGRALTTGIVVLGYWALAVPVGIISLELAKVGRMESEEWGEEVERPPEPEARSGRSDRDGFAPEKKAGRDPCPHCGRTGHQPDAHYCRGCGVRLAPPDPPGG